MENRKDSTSKINSALSSEPEAKEISSESKELPLEIKPETKGRSRRTAASPIPENSLADHMKYAEGESAEKVEERVKENMIEDKVDVKKEVRVAPKRRWSADNLKIKSDMKEHLDTKEKVTPKRRSPI